jgi:mono/diheme cytochrome c family protein
VLAAGAAIMTAVAPMNVRAADNLPAQPMQRELIPGAERLTPAERDAYRLRMEGAKTAEERDRIRAEFSQMAARKTAPPVLTGDPARGAKLHSACFSCHGIERYTAPVTYATASFLDSVARASGLSDLPPSEPQNFKGRIRSLDALRSAVVRRNEFFSPKMTPQEVEDVVAYLNVAYYKFPQQTARAPR